jgi:hypothetical protein
MKLFPSIILLCCALLLAPPGAAKNLPVSEQKTSTETSPHKAFTGSTPDEWADPKSAFILAHFADLNTLQKEIEELRREVAGLKSLLLTDKAKK